MTVYLVGAGPGDPGLLTVAGAALLETCDAVVHDRLVNPVLLERAPRAERFDVGKRPGVPGPTQAEINDLLITLGSDGRTVVRLKGGDPMVFGRGSEELSAVREAGIDVEVVPGVTSAIAAPAAAGIAVTQRGVSSAVTITSGHEDPSGPTSVDWEALGAVHGTIVVLMATRTIGGIAERLMAGGLSPMTPAAAVTDGTLPDQVVWSGSIGVIADADVAAPATFVIGAVASMLDRQHAVASSIGHGHGAAAE
ncbi:MAG: uroporphyrinogen-III C-methyltransferase [Actinomycetota bacterium]